MPNPIITEARSWLGTRFHHQGRIKKSATGPGGCDCIGFILGVAKALDLRSREGMALHTLDMRDYGRLPDGAALQAMLERHLELRVETLATPLQPADLLLMRFDGAPQHVGLVTDYAGGGLGLIHCYAAARAVVEHRLDDVWQQRIVAAYRFGN